MKGVIKSEEYFYGKYEIKRANFNRWNNDEWIHDWQQQQQQKQYIPFVQTCDITTKHFY